MNTPVKKAQALKNISHTGFINGYTVGLIEANHPNLAEWLKEEFSDDIHINDERYEVEFQKGLEVGQQRFNGVASIQKELPGHEKYFLPESVYGEAFHIGPVLFSNENTVVNLTYAKKDVILFLATFLKRGQIEFDFEERKKEEQRKRTRMTQLDYSDNADDETAGVRKNKKAQCNTFAHATASIAFMFNQKTLGADTIYSYFTMSLSENIEERCLKYLDDKLRLNATNRGDSNKAIIFIRRKNDASSWRDLTAALLTQIMTCLAENSSIKDILLMGDALPTKELTIIRRRFSHISIHEMTKFQNEIEFREIMGINSIAGQLYLSRMLQEKFNVKFITGMMSGALDGPAFIGIPVIFFTNGDNRMLEASNDIHTLKPIIFSEDEIKRTARFSQDVLNRFNVETQSILNDTVSNITGWALVPEKISPSRNFNFFKEIKSKDGKSKCHTSFITKSGIFSNKSKQPKAGAQKQVKNTSSKPSRM